MHKVALCAGVRTHATHAIVLGAAAAGWQLLAFRDVLAWWDRAWKDFFLAHRVFGVELPGH